MWFRKTSPRRQAIREDVAESESLGPRERRYRGQVTLIASVFFVVACLVQFWPQPLAPFYVGQKAPVEIRSPVSFTIEDRVKTENKKEFARNASPPVLVAEPLGLDNIGTELIGLKVNLQDAHTLADVPPEIAAKLPGLTADALSQFRTVDTISFRTFVATVLHEIPFISRDDYDALILRKPENVAVLSARPLFGENLPTAPIGNVVIVGNMTAEQRARIQADATSYFGPDLGNAVTAYLAARINKPTYTYDPKLTATLADLRASSQSVALRSVDENKIIVHAGELITLEKLEELTEAQKSLQKKALTSTPQSPWAPWSPWLTSLGSILTVLLITIIGLVYVVRMNGSGGAKTLRQGWAVCGLLLGALILARAIVGYWPQSAYLSAIAPTLFAAIIMVIAYNQRFALGMASLHGLLVVITLGLGVDFFLALLAGAAVYCFGLAEIRTRGRLIEMGFFAGVAIFVAVWALGLTRIVGSVWSPWVGPTNLYVLFEQSLWGFAGGLTVAMIMSAALPPVERIFNISTAMTLLELCDANKPLLRRLQQEAPGTFNHSLTVGIMAEAAGNAIGANGLLCRVGAYYHDVGKLSKPQYFIENQAGGAPNRHEKLSPAMSLLIIVGHVKDGIELAREYNLPYVIHQFIAQHHGTTLVEYFFHAAKKRQEETGEEGQVISDTEFRYPGPKPQTREAAIVMVCDTCESVVRSIDEPTQGRIEAAVHTMISKRLMDGQFSECDLTLRDLSIIEQALTRTLAGIHHGRVAYPNLPTTPPKQISQSA